MVLLLGERFSPGKSAYKADLVEDVNHLEGKVPVPKGAKEEYSDLACKSGAQR